jgi:hypothetical protein
MLIRGSVWPGRSLERKSLKWKCYDKMMDCFLSCAVCFSLVVEGETITETGVTEATSCQGFEINAVKPTPRAGSWQRNLG